MFRATRLITVILALSALLAIAAIACGQDAEPETIIKEVPVEVVKEVTKEVPVEVV